MRTQSNTTNGTEGLVERFRRRYNRLHDEILFKRGVKYYGTALRSFRDFDTYLTHAAFHRLKGLPLPAVMGRNSTPPWFADIREARKIARRNGPAIPTDFWKSLLAGIPAVFFTDPDFIAAAQTIGNKRTGTGNVSFRTMEIRSVSSILCRCQAAKINCSTAILNKSDRIALEYWAGLLTNKRRHSLEPGSQATSLIQAYRACPDHPKYKENILLTGGMLDKTPIWLAEFRKGAGEKVYRIALASMKNKESSATINENRLIRHAFRKYEFFMMELNRQRMDLCVDFVGSTETATAVTGHSIFRMLVAKKIADLKRLNPEAYDALYQNIAAYRYPPFSRVEVVTRADIIRESLIRLKGKLLGFARKNS